MSTFNPAAFLKIVGTYAGASGLIGLCHDCCTGLERGMIAAKGMQQEAKALAARRASR